MRENPQREILIGLRTRDTEAAVRLRILAGMDPAATLFALSLMIGVGAGCPSKEPAGVAAVPDDLSIAVEVDGREEPPLDAARLRATKPDFAAPDGQPAWRLATLLGPPFSRPRTVIEIETEPGRVRTRFVDPAAQEDGRELALTVNRKGEAVVALVDPGDPFPAFHGRGGNRGREGEPAERLRDVRALRLHVPGSGAGGARDAR